MRFLLSVMDIATGTADEGEMAAIDAFNDLLEANGHWIMAGGITAPEHAYVIDNRNGAGRLSAGPLNHNEEYLSGFWVIEADSMEIALGLATKGSKACNRKVEVRAFL